MDTFELDFFKDHADVITPLTIIPVVVYHGLERWDRNNLLEKGRLANLKFFDLSQIPDNQISGTAILRISLLVLKYIKSEELVTKIDEIFELFKGIKDDPDIKEYVRLFFYYVEHAAKVEIRDMLVKKIEQFFTDEELESSTVIRWLEKRGLEKGLEKGLEEGREEGREAMRLIITTDKSDEEISKETGIPVEKIREFRKKFKR